MNISTLLQSKSVMAIINCTPDSFYTESRQEIDTLGFEKSLFEKCEEHIKNGASIVDIGGYSSRPNADDVTITEELNRVIPVIQFIANKFPKVFISIDTFRQEVAEKAIKAGAHIVNDITGGDGDSGMIDFICKTQTPYVLMHMRGTPQTMQSLCNYNDLVTDIITEIEPKISKLKAHEVTVFFDPGFGFSKTLDQNYELLHRLEEFKVLNCPILVGVSRKSMIYKLLNTVPEYALNGTSVLNTIALTKGAKILRVHDSKEAMECVLISEKMERKY